jgi:predicted RNase H-like nuclease (RuvC/YqgF family)
MKLPVFDKQADIPKGFEGLYEEKDGKWQSKASETEKLESTVETLRTETKDLTKKLKAATDAQADLQRKLDVAGKGTEDLDKAKRELLEKWEKDTAAKVKEVQDKLDAAAAQLETYEVDGKLEAMFLAGGGRPEKKASALQLSKKLFKLVDGKLVKVDDKGNPTTEKPEEFFKATFKKQEPEYYQGTKATGGGAAGGTGGSPITTDAAEIDAKLKDPSKLIAEANAAGSGAK